MSLQKSATFLILLWLSLLLVMTPCFAQNKQEHQQLNLNYQRLKASFQHLNIDTLEQIYVDDAVYISESQDKDIIIGKQNVINLYQTFFKKIRHKKARIDIDFRVVARQISSNQATDVGYYLMRFHPDAESGDTVSEFAGKFVSVLTRSSDGHWQINIDSNTRSKPEYYYSAKPVPNWYYGQQFMATTQSANQ
ncbi:YybH family protein [Shewanella gaetbuli]|uniref:Nuclear transport factor 2 family protein n=1 Tax=Shewanella gaetbuli TaxID=220752 RepID=A0A9X1ZMK3_9GAMM|nr:nuclear transport factor 2 family protein [Shewanella gaetbuli]MCL1142507.1 nuclear transport factor 2 family protein [Shewanella gaetbuli]